MFIEDILIYSKYNEEHVKHMKVMLQTLKEKKLYENLSKCEFWLKEVNFLGYVIFSGGTTVDPLEIDAMLHWETPNYITEIIIFLGLAGYYRGVIKGFSKLELPLLC